MNKELKRQIVKNLLKREIENVSVFSDDDTRKYKKELEEILESYDTPRP